MANEQNKQTPSKLEQFKIHFEYDMTWKEARKPYKK
jgi:hypothetical protein